MKPATGRAFWAELHGFAEAHAEVAAPEDVTRAQAWLGDFAVRLRAVAGATCPCADEWDAMVATVPPALGGREAFLKWTWAAHDRVNKKLGRALWYKRSALHPLLRRHRPLQGRHEGDGEPVQEPASGRGVPMVIRTRITSTVSQPCGGGCGG